MNRRRFLQGLGLTALGGALGAGAVELGTYRFGISRHRRRLKGLIDPIRVVQLSDLHFGPFIKAGSVRAWVQAANAQKPDITVITGDLIDSSTRYGERIESEVSPLIEALGLLKAKYGVYAIWGNHDNANPRPKAALERALPEVGVNILNNLGQYLRPDLYLAGVDDRWAGYPNPERALQDYQKGATLMLAHNPDYLDFLRFYPDKISLALCGHTHGGQVRLPGIGAPWTPSYYGQLYLGGFYGPGTGSDLLKIEGFVSRGLGVSAIPTRLGAPAELVVFDFEPSA